LLRVFSKKAKSWRGNEDKFFTYYGNLAFPIYKLATHDQAINFAFEHQPDECLSYLNNELPFGCHGWYPYHIEFWKPYFEKYGFNIGTKKSSI
jgi:hypothetical protein